MARPIIGLEEFIHVHTYNFTSPQIDDFAGEWILLFVLDFMILWELF